MLFLMRAFAVFFTLLVACSGEVEGELAYGPASNRLFVPMDLDDGSITGWWFPCLDQRCLASGPEGIEFGGDGRIAYVRRFDDGSGLYCREPAGRRYEYVGARLTIESLGSRATIDFFIEAGRARTMSPLIWLEPPRRGFLHLRRERMAESPVQCQPILRVTPFEE